MELVPGGEAVKRALKPCPAQGLMASFTMLIALLLTTLEHAVIMVSIMVSTC